MASNNNASTAFFLVLNLTIFFSMAAATASTPPVSLCPPATLELGVCANVLDLVDVRIGAVPCARCCELIHGIVDANAALCLCTAVRLNILTIIDADVELKLKALVNKCSRQLPGHFHCA